MQLEENVISVHFRQLNGYQYNKNHLNTYNKYLYNEMHTTIMQTYRRTSCEDRIFVDFIEREI